MGMDGCTKQGGPAHVSNSDIETKINIMYESHTQNLSVAGLRLKLVRSLNVCTKNVEFIGRVVFCLLFFFFSVLFILVPFLLIEYM